MKENEVKKWMCDGCEEIALINRDKQLFCECLMCNQYYCFACVEQDHYCDCFLPVDYISPSPSYKNFVNDIILALRRLDDAHQTARYDETLALIDDVDDYFCRLGANDTNNNKTSDDYQRLVVAILQSLMTFMGTAEATKWRGKTDEGQSTCY